MKQETKVLEMNTEINRHYSDIETQNVTANFPDRTVHEEEETTVNRSNEQALELLDNSLKGEKRVK